MNYCCCEVEVGLLFKADLFVSCIASVIPVGGAASMLTRGLQQRSSSHCLISESFYVKKKKDNQSFFL